MGSFLIIFLFGFVFGMVSILCWILVGLVLLIYGVGKFFLLLGGIKLGWVFLNEDVFVVYFCIEEKVLYFSI